MEITGPDQFLTQIIRKDSFVFPVLHDIPRKGI